MTTNTVIDLTKGMLTGKSEDDDAVELINYVCKSVDGVLMCKDKEGGEYQEMGPEFNQPFSIEGSL